LNSNLSPKLEDIFNLNHMWSNFVTTSWFLAYLVFSVPSGKLIEKIGYKRTMVTSLFIMVIERCCSSRRRRWSLPVLSDRQLCAGHGRLRFADSAIPTSRFWTGEHRSGSSDAGAGLQPPWFRSGAAGGGLLYLTDTRSPTRRDCAHCARALHRHRWGVVRGLALR